MTYWEWLESQGIALADANDETYARWRESEGAPAYEPGEDWWADVGEAILDPIGTFGDVAGDVAAGVGGLVGEAAGGAVETFWTKAKPFLVFGAAALAIVAVMSLAR